MKIQSKYTIIKLCSAIQIVFLLFASSCKKSDWYDLKSDKKLAVPSDLKEMQSLMDNGQVMNTFTPVIGEIASNNFYLNDSRALNLTSFNWNAYTWTHDQSNVNVSDWLNGSFGSYMRIYYANLVLDGMVKIIPKGDDEQKQWNDIKGQALFHRSHSFFELAQVFAPVYEVNSANSKLGIPLRLESDINIPSKRSTLQQTYDQVISDLLMAKDLLPESPLYRTRPSKQAVYALLARIYLSMENYDQAHIYANLSLDSYKTLINYSILNTTSTANPFIGYNPEIIFYSSMVTVTASTFSNILIYNNFYNSYVTSDLRKKAFFNFNNSTQLVTYKGTYSGSGFLNCFSGLATDEVYLIRAECYARAGKVTEAMLDLNTLLKTRWSGAYTDLAAVDKDDALDKVLIERKKELILRGVRWSDLRRLNRDPRFAITLARTVGGKTYTLEPNSYKYTFPIPDDIIQMTGMQQNEGW